MDTHRTIRCPTCTVEFTLDVPRTWVRCPSCGHGFVVKRVSREMIAPEEPRKSDRPPARARQGGWLVTAPTGVSHRYDTVESLRDAITRGDLEDAVSDSEPMNVSLSEVEVASPLVQDTPTVIPGPFVPPAEAFRGAEVETRTGSARGEGSALAGQRPISDAPSSGERHRPTARPAPVVERSPSKPPRADGERVSVEPFRLLDDGEVDDDEPDADADANAEALALAHGGTEDDADPVDIAETPLLMPSQTALRESNPPVAKKATGTGISKAPEKRASPEEEETRERKTDPPQNVGPRKTATAVARSVTTEAPARSWTLPVLGVAAAGAIVWAILSMSKPPAEVPTMTAPIVGKGAEGATAPTVPGRSPSAVDVTGAAPTTSADPASGVTVIARSTASSPNGVEPAVMTIPATTAITTRGAAGLLDTRPVGASGSAPRAGAEADSGAADTSTQRSDASKAYRSGDFARARSIYEQVVARNPNDVEAWSALGDTARATKNLADAESAYRRALGVNPRYLPALIALADLGWDNGDHAGAQKRYAEIVQRYGNEALPDRVKQRAQ